MVDEIVHKRGVGRRIGRTFVTLVVLVVIIGSLAAAGFFFMLYRDARLQRNNLQSQNNELAKQLAAYKANPSQAAQSEADKEVDKIIAAVGKVYALPKDEKPSVYTVKDKEASKKQLGTFFDKAENGDSSLIYTKAKIAILYRPSTNQVINVSSITIDDKQTTAPPLP